MKTLFIDDADIVDVQIVFEKLGTKLCQYRQQIFLAGIENRQHIFTTETALIAIDKPIQRQNAVVPYKHNITATYNSKNTRAGNGKLLL